MKTIAKFVITVTIILIAAVTQAEEYRVVRGDTLSGIGKRFDVSYQKIMTANRLADSCIFPGQLLKIPVSHVGTYGYTGAPISPVYKKPVIPAPVYTQPAVQVSHKPYQKSVRTYTVCRGDTIAGICRQFNVSSTSLISLNKIRYNTIKHGTVLRIPVRNTHTQLASY